MQRFIALLDNSAGAFGIAFPDCPGCTAMGMDEGEADANAIDALGEWDAGCARRRIGPAAPRHRRLAPPEWALILVGVLMGTGLIAAAIYIAFLPYFGRKEPKSVLPDANGVSPVSSVTGADDPGLYS